MGMALDAPRARVTDITLKTDAELLELRKAGYDGITIGVETGDDDALKFMNKGYCAQEILTQCPGSPRPETPA